MPENPIDERPLKAYYIDKPQRTITTFRVFARSASEALELSAHGPHGCKNCSCSFVVAAEPRQDQPVDRASGEREPNEADLPDTDTAAAEYEETKRRVIAGKASVQEAQEFIDFIEGAIPNRPAEPLQDGGERIAAWREGYDAAANLIDVAAACTPGAAGRAMAGLSRTVAESRDELEARRGV